jgi:hypothetical protein
MLLSTRPGVMGRLKLSRRLRILGWSCTLVMALAVLAMFASMVS